MKRHHVLLLAPFALAHCSSGPNPPPESQSTTRESLYGGGTDGRFWANGTVPVCFQPGNSSHNPWPPTAQLMQLTQETIRDTWARVTNVTFTGWNVCSDSVPTNHPNTLAIGFWTNGGQTDGIGPLADRWRSSGLPVIDSNNDAAMLRYSTIHEVGHALGFNHDQDRPDNWTGSPGHWHSVYCPSDGSGTAGPITGGVYYGPADNDSIMSYCNPTGALGSKDGRLSALDVTGVRSVYPFIDSSTMQSDIPNYHADPSVLTCQYLTDTYGGITNTLIHGYDPSNVHQLWNDLGCNVNSQFDVNTLCQTVSDLYGVNANVTFGYAPMAVQTWWKGWKCNTKPLLTEDICQRASDTYGIVAGATWGTAPSEVQSWWSDPNRGNCQAAPRNPDSCQHFSDLYGAVAGVDFGWAPAAAQTWWTTHGCKSSPITGGARASRCQQLSDLFAMAPGDVAFAPSEAQTWWSANSCTSVPLSANSCQKAADLYYIIPNNSFGAAPSNVQTWWQQVGQCSSLTRLNGRACSDAASRYGIINNVTFGFAPPEVQTWWSGAGNCNAVPSGPQPLPG